ncbi:MAG: dockerin type I domain-containing protein [Clostridiales Family XIII bacterium]|jgi:hypothetical protein|nr:dockerin type I domain-containing protein [Clostridiales Family XIII bacterium]
MNTMRIKTLPGRLLSLILTALLLIGLSPLLPGSTPAQAKTTESPKAETLFFYTENSNGEEVLLKALPFSELDALAHGNPDTGTNYYYSATDNLPIAVYTEAIGFTADELVNYVKTNSSVASGINFSGADRLYMGATDGHGIYRDSLTYDDLYGEQGYYYPGLLHPTTGWDLSWEITGSGYSPTSWPAMPLSTYEENHLSTDPTYAAKAAAAQGKTAMPAILAVYSEGIRRGEMTNWLNSHAGDPTGGLGVTKSGAFDGYALKLCLPQTPDAYYSGNRTMYHYTGWIYLMKLAMENAPQITPLGAVTAPTAAFTREADTLSVTLDCDTPGADIYYSFDLEDAPVTKYTGTPISYNIAAGRDLAASPVKLYMRAVKEGYTDAGIVSCSYPGTAPAFDAIFAGLVGSDVVLSAAAGTDAAAFADWAENISELRLRYPNANTQILTAETEYRVDTAAKTLTLDKSLFSATGSYTLTVSAAGYANKSITFGMQRTGVDLVSASARMNQAISLTFSDSAYAAGVYMLYIKKEGAEGAASTISGTHFGAESGRLIIRASYYGASNCVIKEPGNYILTAINSNYDPVSLEFTFRVLGENEDGVFNYSLLAAKSEAAVGEVVDVAASLTSESGAFRLYGGQYSVSFAAADFGFTGLTAASGWECGSVTQDGRTTLTWLTLAADVTTGTAAEATLAVGTVKLMPLRAGELDLRKETAIVTDADAAARPNVSGVGLSLTAAGAALILGDVNGDGVVATSDAIQIARAIADLVSLTETQRILADLDGDGVITMRDVILTARRAIGL